MAPCSLARQQWILRLHRRDDLADLVQAQVSPALVAQRLRAQEIEA